MTKNTAALCITILLMVADVLTAYSVGYTSKDLWKAAYAGELDKVKSALAAGVNPDTYRDSQDNTALHEASYYNYPAIVRVLVDSGTNLNPQDNWGHTPIAEACQRGNTEIVTLLADAGADVNLPANDGYTPIMKAIGADHPITVQALITAHANIELADQYGNTALHWAAKRNRQEIAQMLLHAGASTEKRNNDGETPGGAARDEGYNYLGDVIDGFVTPTTAATTTTAAAATTTAAATITVQPIPSTSSGLQITVIICGVLHFIIVIYILMKYCFNRTQTYVLGYAEAHAHIHAHTDKLPMIHNIDIAE